MAHKLRCTLNYYYSKDVYRKDIKPIK